MTTEPQSNPKLTRLYEAAKRLAIARHRKGAVAKAAAGLKTITAAMAAERAKTPPAKPQP